MPKTIYNHMQSAVDIVATSPHPTNKIAATITGTDANGEPYALSRVNHWPTAIVEDIGTEGNIGNSSGTVHAETTCILAAPRAEGASIFVTDPPCPNCMKNMAEAGIKALYIDHKGFDKDFAQRRGHHFAHMAMQIAEHAGISVYEIRRKDQTLTPIYEAPEDYEPPEENPVSTDGTIPNEPYAHCKTSDGKTLTATAHPAIGYTSQTLDEPEGKYSFIIQPVNRLLMSAARCGLKIDPDTLFSSRAPTSRELVNMVGAGLTQISIGDIETARDKYGPQALNQLQKAGILDIQHKT